MLTLLNLQAVKPMRLAKQLGDCLCHHVFVSQALWFCVYPYISRIYRCSTS